ncbi:MAG: response regulator [Bacteriovoracaceae bacterium]|nr:response regulator [Bacteriovoracaceae bacterium]
MKSHFERVLLVQSEPELAKYTTNLLDELGFRHIILAKSMDEFTEIWNNSIEKNKKFQLIVCDDEQIKSALQIKDVANETPIIVLSSPNNKNNLRIASRLGLDGLIFRPYGRTQLEKCVSKFLS